VTHTGLSQTVIVEGEGGIGKSRLCLDFLTRIVEARSVRYAFGGGESLITHTPFYAFHQIFAQVLSVVTEETPAQRSQRIHSLLTTVFHLDTHLTQLLPLLNPIVGTVFEETTTTKGYDNKKRLKYTERLLIEILSLDGTRFKVARQQQQQQHTDHKYHHHPVHAPTTDYQPRVIVLEDLHKYLRFL